MNLCSLHNVQTKALTHSSLRDAIRDESNLHLVVSSDLQQEAIATTLMPIGQTKPVDTGVKQISIVEGLPRNTWFLLPL